MSSEKVNILIFEVGGLRKGVKRFVDADFRRVGLREVPAGYGYKEFKIYDTRFGINILKLIILIGIYFQILSQ